MSPLSTSFNDELAGHNFRVFCLTVSENNLSLLFFAQCTPALVLLSNACVKADSSLSTGTSQTRKPTGCRETFNRFQIK